jgi:cobalt-zinc-cadmium efflux system membrane fusion protein
LNFTKKCLLAVTWGVLTASAQAAELIPMTAAQQRSLGIAVAPVGMASGLSSHRMPGEIVVPVGQERVVSASQPGLVDAVLVAPGQSVKKGQALAHVSSPDLVELQRDYLQAATQARLARNKADRDAELFKEGIIAERRYLETKASHEELSAVLSQRRQALRMAGMGDSAIARLESRQEFSSGLTISAPISGEVLESMVTAGQRIDAMTPLFRVGHLSPLWLEIHAPVEAFASVKKGMTVRIPRYEAEGRIIAVIRNINKNDQTMHIRAEIQRNAERLSPGQFVEAELLSSGQADGKLFTVPRNAVVRNGPDSYVFVQDAKGFLPRKVTVLSEQADKTVIAGAIAASDKVAVSGTVAIKAAWVGAAGGDH